MITMVGHVLATRAVTFFAGDAQEKIVTEEMVVHVVLEILRLKISRVTLKRTWVDLPIKPQLSVHIPRTILPSTSPRQVRDGQLEQRVFLPEQVGLAQLAAAGEDPDAFAPSSIEGETLLNCGLKEPVVTCLHDEMQLGISGLEGIFFRGELTEDCVCSRQL